MSEASAVNDQITDAVQQITRLLTAGGDQATEAIGNLVLLQAVTLAMQNAVAQQQQAYILRNAATTAAVQAILESDPEKALDLIDRTLPGEDVARTLDGLKQLLDDIAPAVASAAAHAQEVVRDATASKAASAEDGGAGSGGTAKGRARSKAKAKSSGSKGEKSDG